MLMFVHTENLLSINEILVNNVFWSRTIIKNVLVIKCSRNAPSLLVYDGRSKILGKWLLRNTFLHYKQPHILIEQSWMTIDYVMLWHSNRAATVCAIKINIPLWHLGSKETTGTYIPTTGRYQDIALWSKMYHDIILATMPLILRHTFKICNVIKCCAIIILEGTLY